MSNSKPIGIFDSGVGGTSIWKEINSLLPNENTIYLADSTNAPYGYKSVDEIISLSIKNTELLIEMGAKIIVVACNTATTNAISVLRDKFQIPIIGIEPAIKPAALNSRTGNIGVLATKGTLSSALFSDAAKEYTNHINVIEVIGEGLVPLIEEGNVNSTKSFNLLVKFLQPMIDSNIDQLVLGCSHYPYLIPQIEKILPNNIIIIDSGEAVARQTKSILQKFDLLNNETIIPTLKFYTNTTTNTLEFLLKSFSERIQIIQMTN